MHGNKTWLTAAVAAGMFALALNAQEHVHDHASPAHAVEPPDASVPAPGQPARTLSPDALDSPAATSVEDARRAEAMATAGGGHAGHGGTYRHADAGRSGTPQEAGHHNHPQEEAALYVCPMHPEVTSRTPGSCPKCGMTLVERKKE